MTKTYYQILHVNRDAPPGVIRMAYKVLVQELHPDKSQQDRGSAEAKLKEINEAYTVLSDPRQRANYDKKYPTKDKTRDERPQSAPRTTVTRREPSPRQSGFVPKANQERSQKGSQRQKYFWGIGGIMVFCIALFTWFDGSETRTQSQPQQAVSETRTQNQNALRQTISDQTTPRNVSTQAPASRLNTYKFEISTNVKGASVLMDGVRQGVTPIVLNVPEGWHNFRIEKVGFTACWWKQKIDLNQYRDLVLHTDKSCELD